MSKLSLAVLANRHGTDKGTLGPSSAWRGHNYTAVYETYMQGLRQLPIALLEIGLGVRGDRWRARIVRGRNTGGASLKMWYDYFPKAMIYGIDLNPCPCLNNDRIKTFVIDQGNPDQLQRFVDATQNVGFDFIIDDGSHRPDHQQISLGFLFPRLKSQGCYFIEDLSANGLGDRARGRHTCKTVLNTRKVLRAFSKTGAFPEPNALLSPEYLAQQIAMIEFHHPPRPGGTGKLTNAPELPSRVGMEPLCAITKQ